MADRMISPKPRSEDIPLDTSLRPRSLTEYIGQEKIKENLHIFISAAKAREEALDHVLLYGPPGLGKCITDESYILTDDGWVEFSELIPEGMNDDTYIAHESWIYGLKGLERTSHIYSSGWRETVRLCTRSGFEIEGTPNHQLIVAGPGGPQWKRLDELTEDEFVAIGRGLRIWGAPQVLSFRPTYLANRQRREMLEREVLFVHQQLSAALGRPPANVELRFACQAARSDTPIHTARRLGLPLSDGRRVETQRLTVSLPDELLLPSSDSMTFPDVLTSELAYLMGVVIGDGSFDQGVNFPAGRITNTDGGLLNEIERIFISHFNYCAPPKDYSGRAPFIAFSQNIGHFLIALGVNPVSAEKKEVPRTILRSPANVVASFLQGLFDADGNVWPEGYVEYSTKSVKLARQVQLLLANFGIIAHRHNKIVKGQPYQRLFIGGRDAVLFHRLIGFRSSYKREREAGLMERERGVARSDLVPFAHVPLKALLDKTRPHPHAVHKRFEHVKQGDRLLSRDTIQRYLRLLPDSVNEEPEMAILQSLIDPHIYWDRVATLEWGTARVYDFCVPGSHSFVANGMFNHNTTLAHVIAHEMEVGIKVTAGPAIERAGDLAAILTNLRQSNILFIDEVHRLGRAVEETLYPAMEDYALDIIIGKGPSARSIRLKLPRFTLIGATTRLALMTSPLRNRFGVIYRLDFYEQAAMEAIVHRSAGILGVGIDEVGAEEIARRARGTPRVANRLLRRVRDYAQVRAQGHITQSVAREALTLLEVDESGLDDIDRRVLRTIIEKFDGGPVGLETIAAALSEESDTIMDVVEPYLLQLGFLDRTPRGRVATRRAYEHLGIEYPQEEEPQQPTLF